MRWEQFVQKVRAHAPDELLPAVAAASARLWAEPPTVESDPRRLQPWALAAVARESLAWGNPHRRTPVDERTLPALQHALVEVDDPYLQDPQGNEGPFGLMVRLAYEQAPWQDSPFNATARFGVLFDRDLTGGFAVLSRDSLTGLLGADPTLFAAAATVFLASVGPNAGWFDLAWLDTPQLAPVVGHVPAHAISQVFLSRFAAPYDDVRDRARSSRNPDPLLRRFDVNPLRATPFVGMPDGRWLAPSQPLVVDRLTLDTVYYAGLQEHGPAFASDLGRLVETYVGEQLAHVPGAVLVPERAYGKGGGRRTADWVLVLPDLVLVVEVKLARVTAAGRLGLQAWVEDVEPRIGKGLKQVARTARLLTDGHDVLHDVPTGRPVRGIVVTSSQHYLANQPAYRQHLHDPEIPTAVLSLDELEHAVSWTLLRDPTEVFTTLTDWHPELGLRPEGPLRRWFDQHALTVNPPNPVLQPAWDQAHAWVEALQD